MLHAEWQAGGKEQKLETIYMHLQKNFHFQFLFSQLHSSLAIQMYNHITHRYISDTMRVGPRMKITNQLQCFMPKEIDIGLVQYIETKLMVKNGCKQQKFKNTKINNGSRSVRYHYSEMCTLHCVRYRTRVTKVTIQKVYTSNTVYSVFINKQTMVNTEQRSEYEERAMHILYRPFLLPLALLWFILRVFFVPSAFDVRQL